MNSKSLATFLAAIALLAPSPLFAKTPPTLLPFAGSYTGTSTSTNASGTVSASSTLTFTGRKNSLRGTFLFTGIINSGDMPKTILQTFNISKQGIMNGRVTVDGIEGLGTGQAQMHRRSLSVSVTYTVGPAPGTTISILGTVTFQGKHASWTATVTSSDPSYDSSLTVIGKR